MAKYKLISIDLPPDMQLDLSSLYKKIKNDYQESFLMEANDYLPNENCHSFLGFNSLASLIVTEDQIVTSIEEVEASKTKKKPDRALINQELMGFIDQLLPANYDQQKYLGLYGYLSYDSITHFESLKFKQNLANAIPCIQYHLYEYLIIQDVDLNQATIYQFVLEDVDVDSAIIKLKTKFAQIQQLEEAKFSFQKVGEERSNLTNEQHRQIIEKAKEHIQRGDVFQIVPSRSYLQDYRGEDFVVYQKLKEINPSPYLYYYQYKNFSIFGSSPESNLIVQDGKAYLHPIAGTYPNVDDPVLKQKQIKKMQLDPKENSEHVMLVDLARNDLSKSCLNVRVHQFKKVEEFSHVLHLVSLVGGELIENASCFELLSDTFPAGTLSGAPKIRAMEIIDELEPDRREFYGGAIGYLGFNNECIHAIMIRSFLSRNNCLIRRAGGGVVSESVVQSEIQEVINKLGALAKAIKLSDQNYNDRDKFSGEVL